MQDLNEKSRGSGEVALTIWFYTIVLVDTGVLTAMGAFNPATVIMAIPLVIASCFVGLPALGILAIVTACLRYFKVTKHVKLGLLHLSIFFIGLMYGLLPFLFEGDWRRNFPNTAIITAILYAGGFISTLVNSKMADTFLSVNSTPNIKFKKTIKNNNNMYENNYQEKLNESSSATNSSNKIFIKSIITAALILAMLIPATLVENIITERQERQKQVVDEVSSKWALPQTVSAPYLVIPYTEGKERGTKSNLLYCQTS